MLGNNPFMSKSRAVNPISLDTLTRQSSSTPLTFQPSRANLQTPAFRDQNIDNNTRSANLTLPKQIQQTVQRPIIFPSTIRNSQQSSNENGNTQYPVNSNSVNSQFGDSFLDHPENTVYFSEMEIAKENIQKLREVKCFLKPLFNIIRNGNEQIKKRIVSVKRQLIQLLLQQNLRVLLGLSFYRPISNKAIDFLELCFKKHILYKQIKMVSQKYKLDFHISLYVVKEVYIYQQRFPRSKTCFFSLSAQNLLDNQFLIKGVGEFLVFDKKNLISFYSTLLHHNYRPSYMHLCSIKQELDVIQRSIYCLQDESKEIQLDFFNLFMKYCKTLDQKKDTFIEKKVKRFQKVMLTLKLDPSIRRCLLERNAEEMLENQNFRPQQLEGHLRDLGEFLINRKNINYEDALQRLSHMSVLSERWITFLKKYIQQIDFKSQSKVQALLKGIYLHKIMKDVVWNNNTLDKSEEIGLICKIMKFSLSLAIAYLQLLKSREARIEVIKMLVKYNQICLRQCDQECGFLIAQYVQGYYHGRIISYFVENISAAFLEFIERDDFTIFETVISGGRALGFNFDPQKGRGYQSVKFYQKLLEKYSSCLQEIHFYLTLFLKQLKKKGLSITASLQGYNNTLLSIGVPFGIVSQHLTFSAQILDDAASIARIAKSWFRALNRHEEFPPFVSFFINFSQKVFEQQHNQQELNTLNQGLEIFAPSIAIYVCTQKDSFPFLDQKQVKVLKILYNIKQFYNFIKIEPPKLLSQLFASIIQRIAQVVPNPLKIIFPNESHLSASHKLILFDILTEFQEEKHFKRDNSISKLVRLLKESDIIPVDFMIVLSKQLKSEETFDVISVLQALCSIDDTFTRNVAVQNCSQFMVLLQKMKDLTFFTLNQTLTIISRLHNLTTTMLKVEEKQRLFHFVQTLQTKVLQWFVKGKVTEILFSPLFNFFSEDITNIDSSYHISFLWAAKEANFFRLLKNTQMDRLSFYGFVLINTCVSKRSEKGTKKPEAEAQIKTLKKQIQIFTDMGVQLFNHYRDLIQGEQISKIGKYYFALLNALLDYYQRYPKGKINYLIKRCKVALQEAQEGRNC